MSDGLKIAFTGAGDGLGAYMAQWVNDNLSHTVFTFGLGCTCPVDFRYLSPIKARECIAKASAALGGSPDVVVHNARTLSGGLSHAFQCNVQARSVINQAFLDANAGSSRSLRIIDIAGYTPEWALKAEVPMVSEAAQKALCEFYQDFPNRAKLEEVSVVDRRLTAYQKWASSRKGITVKAEVLQGVPTIVAKDAKGKIIELPPEVDPTNGQSVWVPKLSVVRLRFNLLRASVGQVDPEYASKEGLMKSLNVAPTPGAVTEVVVA